MTADKNKDFQENKFHLEFFGANIRLYVMYVVFTTTVFPAYFSVICLKAYHLMNSADLSMLQISHIILSNCV